MARPRVSNPKSVLLALRVTPRIRFALDLIAQRTGRTVSQVVSHAIDEAIVSPNSGLVLVPAGERTPVNVLDRVWSPQNESEGVVRLGLWFPELLDEEQRYLWRVIWETPEYWRRGKRPTRPDVGDVQLERLARDWRKLKKQARAI